MAKSEWVSKDEFESLKEDYEFLEKELEIKKKQLQSKDEEINALDNFEPKQTAIVDKRFEKNIDNEIINSSLDSNSIAYVSLETYKPNYLKYNCETNKKRVVVFSEIYYDKGWKAFIDGKETPYFRANYVLRAMMVPKGKHTIEFKFEPSKYYAGENISLIGLILLLILVLSALGYGLKTIKKNNLAKEINEEEDDEEDEGDWEE